MEVYRLIKFSFKSYEDWSGQEQVSLYMRRVIYCWSRYAELWECDHGRAYHVERSHNSLSWERSSYSPRTNSCFDARWLWLSMRRRFEAMSVRMMGSILSLTHHICTDLQKQRNIPNGDMLCKKGSIDQWASSSRVENVWSQANSSSIYTLKTMHIQVEVMNRQACSRRLWIQ